MVKTISPKGSMKGYKFSIWWNKNKETVKTLLSAGIGIAVFFIPQLETPQLSAAAGVVSAALTKLIVDGIDFALSDVKLDN